jgi:hypothetical protein
MSRQDDIDVGNSEEFNADRLKAMSKSLYRGCQTHGWMHIDSCTTEIPTRCPKCEIERLREALRRIATNCGCAGDCYITAKEALEI